MLTIALCSQIIAKNSLDGSPDLVTVCTCVVQTSKLLECATAGYATARIIRTGEALLLRCYDTRLSSILQLSAAKEYGHNICLPIASVRDRLRKEDEWC